jgi:hypothetical protein
MKPKFACVISACALALSIPAFAANGPAANPATKKARQPPEWAGVFGDASLPVIWQSAQAADEKIAAVLKEKALARVPDWAETMHLASHALQAQVKVADPDQQGNLADACRVAARIADDVTAAAGANDVDQTNVAYHRMKLALNIAPRCLPPDLAHTSPAPVRFAKKERK